jgi:hypothetical protein
MSNMKASGGAGNNDFEEAVEATPGRGIPAALLLVIALGTLFRLYLLRYAHATEEDFYITLRYARNLAEGHGFVYNPGERVLGTTTPLYTLFLALLIRLGLNPILGGKLLGILADAVSCFAIYRLARAAGRPGAGIAAAVCIATLPTNLTWATKGMEVGTVAAVATTAWAAFAERRIVVAWIAAAILVLLRIDGLALVALLLAASLWQDRRMPWRGMLAFILLLAPWLIFSTLYFGSPVPASLRAKLIVYGHHATTPFPRLGSFLTLMLHPAGAIIAIGAVCAFCALFAAIPASFHKRSRQRADADAAERPQSQSASSISVRALLPPGLWILVYYAGMAFSKVFLFGWYFVPPTPIYYLISMIGWAIVLERIGAALRRPLPLPSAPVRAIAAVVATLALGRFSAPTVLADLRSTQLVEDGLRIPIARWFRAHARPTDTLMLEPIGYIGYYSGLKILDTVGLVSPEVLPYWQRDVHSPLHSIWSRFQPEWILLRNGERQLLGYEEAVLPPNQRLTAHYRLVSAWTDPAFPHATPSFYLYAQNGHSEAMPAH